MLRGLPYGTVSGGALRRMAVLAITLSALMTAVQVTTAQAEPMPTGIPGTWALRVNEEFSGAGINTALWAPGWQSDASITGPISGECEAKTMCPNRATGTFICNSAKNMPPAARQPSKTPER
jgi:hypothetical protein